MNHGAPPPVTWTSRALTVGTLASATCFVVSLTLSLAGADVRQADPMRFDQVIDSVVLLQPWGWSMLGVLVLLATPALGLVTSALELRAAQRGPALLALAVLGILVLAAIVALSAG